jgi:hypothetical protein
LNLWTLLSKTSIAIAHLRRAACIFLCRSLVEERDADFCHGKRITSPGLGFSAFWCFMSVLCCVS